MDDARVLRLDMMHQQLKQLMETIEISLRKDTISDKELYKAEESLVVSIDRFSTEIHMYLEKGSGILTEKITEFTKTQLKAEEWKVEINTLIKTNKATLSSSVPMTSKLPKLTLPKYDGDILHWKEFWERFETDIHERNLPGADKLSYLVGCLEGDALKTIEGLSKTHANYDIAVESLKNRYGDQNRLIDAHYEALHSLPRATRSAPDCRTTLNNVERHLRVLDSLGEQIDGNHFRASILSKFSEQVIYELNLIIEQKDMRTIRSGLDKIISAMETARRDVSGPSNSHTEITTGALQICSELKSRPRLKGKEEFQKRPIKGNEGKLRNRPQKRKQSNYTDTTERKMIKMACIFCQGDHYNGACPVVKTVEERKIKLAGRCFQCFKKGHKITACPLKKKLCYYCKGDHNQALCFKNQQSMNSINNLTPIATICKLLKNNSFLQTATVTARRQRTNNTKSCRLLLDCGSQRSYITSRLARELLLPTVKEDLLMIFVFGSDKPIETLSPATEIEIETKRGVKKNIHVNIVPHITDRIPIPEKLDEIKSVDVVADDGSVGERVDLLIGNDYYFSFMKNEIIKIQDDLFLIDTDFGWMLTGRILKQDKEDVLSVITYCQCEEPESVYFMKPDLPLLETDLKFLWALESIGIVDSPKITREEEAVKQFNETVKYENRRYQVKWPWIIYPPELPTNYGLAYGRLSSLIKRLDQEIIQEYNLIIEEQLDAEVIEIIEPQPVKNFQVTPPIHYLPHHIIKQEGKRGRIVYDASAKLKDSKSLNECMYRGPSMLEDLTALLLKFRTNQIGITADVEKAFLQVGLQTEDRDVTRFLWLKDTKKEVTEDNILHLRFCRVPFGVISSPFLLTATLRYHLSRRDEKLMKEIAERCYVDNLVTGTNSVTEARNLINKTRDTFKELSMNIRDWTSNSKQVIKTVPSQYRGKNSGETKVLGLIWNLEKDTMRLKLSDNLFNWDNINKNKNKRGILRTLASLYDPCGFAAPLVLPAKLLLQELWRRKLKWDIQLPEELEEQWNAAVKALQTTKEIEVPRFIGSTSEETEEYELHCFTDASKNSFAAVTYLRIINKKERTHKVAFIMAKTRVTPITYKEDLRIPRLELLGYVIGKRLLSYVRNNLGLHIKRQCLWTDSGIVIYWMRSEKLLPPFVSKRIAEIKQSKDIEPRYVNTEVNPADVATRPELWETKKEMWFEGPQFLLKNEDNWPALPKADQTTLYSAHEGLNLNSDSDVEVIQQRNDQGCMETEAVGQIEKNSSHTQEEVHIEDHKTREIKRLQELHFAEEMMGKETHLTRNLGLFMDMDGILRCQGRLMNTMCSYDTKHPILIPKDCEFTDKLIQEIHEQNHHVGASHTLSIIRQKYWIPQGKAKVQRILRKCPQCVKHGSGPYELPPTPVLPAERANYSAPFTYTGIDYFGPVYIDNNGKKEKRWVCLYTCLAVRAVHMEIVCNLTAEECLLALRRFVSARGLPELIMSDNGLQFKLSAEMLSSSYCIENRIRWRFIPQLSPWHGGFYERLVGLVKNCLKRTLGKQLLSDTQLHTIIKEIEAVVNTRPLTSVGSEIEYTLRPVDFLTFGRCISITPLVQGPVSGGTVTKQNLIKSWKKGQNILDEFKKMFIGQYLCSLRERYQNSFKQPRIRTHKVPRVGDIVQIKGESKNRENWRVGRINSLIQGSDGECRVARVLVESKEFIRSVGHLYPLEVEDETTVTPEIRERNTGAAESSPPPSEAWTAEQAVSSETHTPLEEPLHPEDTFRVDVTPMDQDLTNLGNHAQPKNPSVEMEEQGIFNKRCDENEDEGEVTETGGDRIRRKAALKAREKIALWTRQLLALL